MANSHIWNWNEDTLIRRSHISTIKIVQGSLRGGYGIVGKGLIEDCTREWNVEATVRGKIETLIKGLITEEDARQWIKDDYLSKSKSKSESENKEASDASGEAYT